MSPEKNEIVSHADEENPEKHEYKSNEDEDEVIPVKHKKVAEKTPAKHDKKSREDEAIQNKNGRKITDINEKHLEKDEKIPKSEEEPNNLSKKPKIKTNENLRNSVNYILL